MNQKNKNLFGKDSIYALLAFHIPAAREVRWRHELSRNELLLLAAIKILEGSNGRGCFYPAELKKVLGTWQKSYIHLKVKHLLKTGYINKFGQFPKRVNYYLNMKGKRALEAYKKAINKTIDEYLTSHASTEFINSINGFTGGKKL